MDRKGWAGWSVAKRGREGFFFSPRVSSIFFFFWKWLFHSNVLRDSWNRRDYSSGSEEEDWKFPISNFGNLLFVADIRRCVLFDQFNIRDTKLEQRKERRPRRSIIKFNFVQDFLLKGDTFPLLRGGRKRNFHERFLPQRDPSSRKNYQFFFSLCVRENPTLLLDPFDAAFPGYN